MTINKQTKPIIIEKINPLKPVLLIRKKNTEIKIGEFVRQNFIKLSKENKLSELMLMQLQNADYSKSTFIMNYPVLKLIDYSKNILEQRKINGRDRYWEKPYYDNKYFICNDWYDDKRNQRSYFEKWLKDYNTDTSCT